MKKIDRERLSAAGWLVGDASEFLGLTPEEEAFVELRLALAEHLREVRKARGWTQTEVAQLLGSSQSRVAKIEAADPSVSLDLVIRALLSLGVTRREVGSVIAESA